MTRVLAVSLTAMFAAFSFGSEAERTAPTPRYLYTIKVDEKSLPKDVTVREAGAGAAKGYFIKNGGAVPLIIDEVHQNGKLVSGQKLENGKVYGWFPTGVPMQGKQHLTGWQAPFGDIAEVRLGLPRDLEGKVGAKQQSKELPKPEDAVIPCTYDGKPYEIKITIQYAPNPAFEKK